jgi:hypothetical protein
MPAMRDHTVYVIRVPKDVVTKEIDIFTAMCKVTYLRILECERNRGVYVYVCICSLSSDAYSYPHDL